MRENRAKSVYLHTNHNDDIVLPRVPNTKAEVIAAARLVIQYYTIILKTSCVFTVNDISTVLQYNKYTHVKRVKKKSNYKY